jgi:TIR domain-containing protein/carboxypeptidase family protein
MRVFLSYAHEQRETADALSLRLHEAGHDVFFDKDDLPAAESFDDRIRRGLERSDLLVFLVSPESIGPGGYTLTELELARQRWPNPGGHVLPVMVAPTPYDEMPEYLKAVTVLEPKGNVVAEAAAAVEGVAGRARRRRLGAAALVLGLVAVGGAAAWYATRPRGEPRAVSGTVTDITTESPVPGASVKVQCRRSVSPEVFTDNAGRFDLGQVRCPEDPTLVVSHRDYAEQSRRLAAGGTPAAIGLLPRNLGTCVLNDAHGVVVGHFRPPVSAAAGSDLAGRVAEALTYDVLTVLQTLNLPPEQQPRFIACDEAQPRSVDFAAAYARAFKADAFLVGSVEPAEGAFNVRAFVGDAFQLFKPPRPLLARGVALNDTAVARLGPDMRAVILTALARGFAERGKFSECVDVAVAASRLLTDPLTALDQTLARCQDSTGVGDLRRGG